MNLRTDIADDDAEWDWFVSSSPQGSIFMESCFLHALDEKYVRYFIRNISGEPLAGIAIPIADGKVKLAPLPFAPYQGILFSARETKLAEHKHSEREFRLTETIIHEILDRHKSFSLCLSPSFKDIRPFLWHGFNEQKKESFSVNNRYTAILDLADFDREAFTASLQLLRRRELKRPAASISPSHAVDNLLALYKKTFARQDIEVDDKHLERVARITECSLARGFGYLTEATTTDGELASMALFLHDNRAAYYLVGANDPQHRGSGASTQLMLHNICYFAARKLQVLDFVGANSPNRASYKLSFNSKLQPYFEVQLRSASRGIE